MRFITRKKNKITTVNVSAFASFALLHLFFTLNFVVFVDGGRKNISCPRSQSTLATPLATFAVFSILGDNESGKTFERRLK